MNRIYKKKLTVHSDGHKIYEYKELWYSKIFFFIKNRLSKSYKSELLRKKAYEYMRDEWKKTSPSYMKYFDMWMENITEHQLSCIFVWMNNKLGPMP